jgi:hypothetical protein
MRAAPWSSSMLTVVAGCASAPTGPVGPWLRRCRDHVYLVPWSNLACFDEQGPDGESSFVREGAPLVDPLPWVRRAPSEPTR